MQFSFASSSYIYDIYMHVHYMYMCVYSIYFAQDVYYSYMYN